MPPEPNPPSELDRLQKAAHGRHLTVLGGFHPASHESCIPAGTGTLLLLGPHEPGFWATVSAAPEFRDNAPDPLDRWSERVIGELALRLGAQALFPFTGPPFAPFIAWAGRSRRIWPSPVSLLVHEATGLFLSIRGALALPTRIDLPPASVRPCNTCVDRPCLTACPVDAWSATGYDSAACHRFLDSPAGHDCMDRGCLTRRACPLSQACPRPPAQTAFQMRAFHGTR